MTSFAMRSMYVAPKGHKLVQWDLSQAETWIVAYLADEPSMKESLHHGDIHTDTAALAIYHIEKSEVSKVQRYLGKKGNHSLSYGSTHYRLAQSINAESDNPPFVTVSISEAKDIYSAWHSFYRIKDWWQGIQEELQYDRTLTTPYGRTLTFFEAWGEELFKAAYAFKPQSTVADHLNGRVQEELGIRGGLVEVHRQFVEQGIFSICNQSHDSFIAIVPDDKVSDIIPVVTSLIKRPIVIGGDEFTIPVDCEIGERWGELEKVAT
jgi:DNA polymerase I